MGWQDILKYRPFEEAPTKEKGFKNTVLEGI